MIRDDLTPGWLLTCAVVAILFLGCIATVGVAVADRNTEGGIVTMKLAEGGPVIVKPKPASKEVQQPPIEWINDLPQGIPDNIQLGLRADGAVIWRRICDRCGEALPTWDGRFDERCDCKWGVHKDSCSLIGLGTPCPALPVHICKEKRQ